MTRGGWDPTYLELSRGFGSTSFNLGLPLPSSTGVSDREEVRVLPNQENSLDRDRFRREGDKELNPLASAEVRENVRIPVRMIIKGHKGLLIHTVAS